MITAMMIAGADRVSAQLSNFSHPSFRPTKSGQFDTLARQRGASLAVQTAGLLEAEIDAATYVVGPGDVLMVSVYTTESVHHQVGISPEGRLVVPRVGTIDVRGRTLVEVRRMVDEAVRKTFRVASTDVTLSALRSFKVSILGAVQAPTVTSATAADRVFDVLQRVGGILDTGTVRGIMLLRDGQDQPIVVDLQRYLANGDRRGNPTVQGGDRIIVPMRSFRNTIGISGEVVQAGTFEYLPGDSLSALIRFAGGFLPSAHLDSVELVRVSEQGSGIEEMVLNMRSWTAIMTTSAPMSGDMALRAGDRVYVRAIPRWRERHDVIVSGEAVYPGRYAIEPGATRLTEILRRAGGFTAKASLEDAIIIRRSEMSLEDREFKRLERLPPSEMSTSELQYYKTKAREVKGVMSVSFVDLFQRNQLDNDPVMRDGDSIHIPERNLYINVSGSVRNPGRIVFRPGLTYMQYIDLAGGYGFRADKGSTQVVKVKGDAFPAESENYVLEPGDNIIILDEAETKFINVFTQALTIAAQIVTVVGVVFTLVRLQ